MKLKKVIVTGGRGYMDKMRVFVELNAERPSIVVHGACKKKGSEGLSGADRWADEWGNEQEGVDVQRYPANWTKYGLGAGPVRNQVVVDEHPDADTCLAFPGGRGTADMVRRCRKAGIPVREIR